MHLAGPCCKVTLGLRNPTEDPLHFLSDVVYIVEHEFTVIYRPDILETLDLVGEWCPLVVRDNRDLLSCFHNPILNNKKSRHSFVTIVVECVVRLKRYKCKAHKNPR